MRKLAVVLVLAVAACGSSSHPTMKDYALKTSVAIGQMNAAMQTVLQGGDAGGMAALCGEAVGKVKKPEDVLRHVPDAPLRAIALKYISATDLELADCAAGNLDAATFQVQRANQYLKLMSDRVAAITPTTS